MKIRVEDVPVKVKIKVEDVPVKVNILYILCVWIPFYIYGSILRVIFLMYSLLNLRTIDVKKKV